MSKAVGKSIFGQCSESVCSDAAQGTKYMLMLPRCSNDPKKLFALLLSGVPCCRQHYCPLRKLIESTIKGCYTRLEKKPQPHRAKPTQMNPLHVAVLQPALILWEDLKTADVFNLPFFTTF